MQESITNEWVKFLVYTKEPTYATRNKKDNGFLGRFTLDMLIENYGFARILTVLACGYLFHNPDGTLKDGDRMNTQTMPDALFARGAVFRTKNCHPPSGWQFKTNFRELHDEFPELVDPNGCGGMFVTCAASQNSLTPTATK